MLKRRVTKLIHRYELDEEIMTALDVCHELQDILDDEPHNGKLTRELQKAIDDYTLARRDYNRYAGHCSDGADEFIKRVEEIIEWGVPKF